MALMEKSRTMVAGTKHSHQTRTTPRGTEKGEVFGLRARSGVAMATRDDITSQGNGHHRRVRTCGESRPHFIEGQKHERTCRGVEYQPRSD